MLLHPTTTRLSGYCSNSPHTILKSSYWKVERVVWSVVRCAPSLIVVCPMSFLCTFPLITLHQARYALAPLMVYIMESCAAVTGRSFQHLLRLKFHESCSNNAHTWNGQTETCGVLLTASSTHLTRKDCGANRQ